MAQYMYNINGRKDSGFIHVFTFETKGHGASHVMLQDFFTDVAKGLSSLF